MTGHQKALWIAVVMFLLGLWCLSYAIAQDGDRHPQQDIDAHRSFYWYLTRPDIPDAPRGSCCSDGDCYSTPARFENGSWWALRREDRRWIEVPSWRVVTREDELVRRTDTRATLCATVNTTYCFVPPETEM